MDLNKLEEMEYTEIFKYVTSEYIREFGEIKFKTILIKIMTSNKISGLISKARYSGLPPGSKDYIYCVNTITYFFFFAWTNPSSCSLNCVAKME